MKKTIGNKIEPAKLLSLVAVMSLAITAISTEQAFAFDLSENDKQSTLQKTFFIASDEPSDCDSIGQWDQLSKTCAVDSKLTIGINDKVIVQPNAVLEISETAAVILYGTIENRGTINLHGLMYNHGSIENFDEVNNDGLLQNYWGKITNNKEARLTNGAYTYDNVGLRFVGTVDNRYGIIINYGTLSNQSTIDNNWGKIFNNCDGTLLGIGPVLGNDPNEVDCSSVNEQVQGQNWI